MFLKNRSFDKLDDRQAEVNNENVRLKNEVLELVERYNFLKNQDYSDMKVNRIF